MVPQFVNYNKSVPTNFSGTLSRTVPSSPSSVNLANFSYRVNTENTDVLLRATVGWTSTLGAPQILFKIRRGTTEIFSTLVSTEAVNEFVTTSFQAVDMSVPPGAYAIILSAQIENPPLNEAVAIGPVTFTAESIALD